MRNCKACKRVKKESGYCTSHTPFIAGDGGSMSIRQTAAFVKKLLKKIEVANRTI